jgi:hypothetical protein
LNWTKKTSTSSAWWKSSTHSKYPISDFQGTPTTQTLKPTHQGIIKAQTKICSPYMNKKYKTSKRIHNASMIGSKEKSSTSIEKYNIWLDRNRFSKTYFKSKLKEASQIENTENIKLKRFTMNDFSKHMIIFFYD